MRRLIVQIPELEYFPGGASALPRAPARLLGRARRFEAGDPDRVLGEVLGLDDFPGPAALARLASGAVPAGSADSVWLRFDPVGMVPDLTAVWVERPFGIDFSAEAMEPLASELKAMFAAEGLDWQPVPGAGYGLIELEARPEVDFPPLSAVPGRRLDEVLPEGPDASRWRRLINESQMVFHRFRPPGRADQRGAGLWFWGAGSIPPSPAAPPVRIIDDSGDAWLCGLARWLGAEIDHRTGRLPAIPDDEIVLLRWSLAGSDPAASLEELARQWLDRARGRTLEIVGSAGYWRLTLLDRLRLWRRGRPAGFIEGPR